MEPSKDHPLIVALTPYEVNVKGNFALKSKRHRYYWKDCYRRAHVYTLNLSKEVSEGVRLIHGKILAVGYNHHYDHAWVELPGGIVFDGVMNTFYDQNGYYQTLEPVKVAEYKRNEAIANVIKYKHYGPWD